MNTCMRITESLCCTPETNNIVNQRYSNKIKILKKIPTPPKLCQGFSELLDMRASSVR